MTSHGDTAGSARTGESSISNERQSELPRGCSDTTYRFGSARQEVQQVTHQTSEKETDALQLSRDMLFSALQLAIPGATHQQILNVTKCVEQFASVLALEIISQ